MATLNKAIILGRLGQNPELKQTSNGKLYCRLSVATSEKFKTNNDWQERTEWHQVMLWGKKAETTAQYLSKGSQVMIEGRLETSSYEKEGQKHFSTQIIADKIGFLDKAEKKNDYDNGAADNYDVDEIPF